MVGQLSSGDNGDERRDGAGDTEPRNGDDYPDTAWRHTGDDTWFRLSIVPLVIAVLRYALVVDQGGGGAPEEVVLSDRVLQIVGLIWLVTFALGVRG